MPDSGKAKTEDSQGLAAGAGQSPDGAAGLARIGAAGPPAASEIGAAMAHQLSGPVTALLLHVGYIQQNRDRFIASDDDVDLLQQAIDSAVQAAEQLFGLIHRMGDGFEAPIRKETAVAAARDAIAWWSRTSGARKIPETIRASGWSAGRIVRP